MEEDGDSDVSAMVNRVSSALGRFVDATRSVPYRGAAASLYVQGKVLELMVEVLAGPSTPEAPPDGVEAVDHRRAWAARDIMAANLADPPHIGEIAKQVGLSQRRLNEVFKDLFGASALQYLTYLRLDEAQTLLTRGELSVKQVAHAMGYAHVSSFSYAYARRFGRPPSLG